MRGSVGRAFARVKRYKEDEAYREKRKNINREYRKKNREKIIIRKRKRVKELNEFRNRIYKECGKLLNYKTKGDYCNKHAQWRHKR